MDKQQPLTESIFYIMLALRKPNHGYGIIQEVQQLTNNRINMGAGTLYGAIQSLEQKGWITIFSEEEASRKKKEYILTDLGREVFKGEVIRLSELIEHAKLIEE